MLTRLEDVSLFDEFSNEELGTDFEDIPVFDKFLKKDTDDYGDGDVPIFLMSSRMKNLKMIPSLELVAI